MFGYGGRILVAVCVLQDITIAVIAVCGAIANRVVDHVLQDISIAVIVVLVCAAITANWVVDQVNQS